MAQVKPRWLTVNPETVFFCFSISGDALVADPSALKQAKLIVCRLHVRVVETHWSQTLHKITKNDERLTMSPHKVWSLPPLPHIHSANIERGGGLGEERGGGL